MQKGATVELYQNGGYDESLRVRLVRSPNGHDLKDRFVPGYCGHSNHCLAPCRDSSVDVEVNTPGYMLDISNII